MDREFTLYIKVSMKQVQMVFTIGKDITDKVNNYGR